MKKQSPSPHASPSPRSSHPNPSKLLDVYIRNNKMQALMIHTTPDTHIEHLARLIHARFHVPPDQQILFNNGTPINQSPHNPQVTLQDRTIIHLVDRRNIQPEITINVRRLNLPTVQQFRIPSAQIIEDFIVRNIREEEPDKMFFVYTGRQLNKSRSFAEEFVETESQLFCLHQEKDQVKGEKKVKYQEKIKEEAAKKQQQKLAHPQQEEVDSSLQNYLPKQQKPQQAKSQSKLQQIKDERPNFKKKNVTKQINLAANDLLPPSAPNLEGNLSIMAQNNFQQARSAITNAFFNEGSSISQIVAEDSHNPESCKKLQEGSMFQSAFIGLNNQVSFINHNPTPSRPATVVSSDDHETSQNEQPASFSFDARAPEMIPQPPNRQLTIFQREILQVTESQQLSKQVVSEQQKKPQQSINKQSGQVLRQQGGSIQNCQFELGDIENHQLSASAQMEVLFQEKESPQRASPQKNQILIEDEENIESQIVRRHTELLPVQEHNNQQDSIKYIGVEYEQGYRILQLDINNRQASSSESKNTQFRGSAVSCKQVDNIQFIQEKQMQNNPQFIMFPQFPQQSIDIYLIEQQNAAEQQNNPHGSTPNTVSQVIEQKQQCETNGPEGSSNFYSKNSSRVQPNTVQPNQYEFGNYQKRINSATRRSDFRQANNYESDDQLLDSHKSQSSKMNRENQPHHFQLQQHNTPDKNNEQDQQSLQIVQLPIDIRARQHSSMLLDFQSSLEPQPKPAESSQLKGKTEGMLSFRKESSKIDELNHLESCISNKNIQSPPKPHQQHVQRNSLPRQQPKQIQKLQSEIVFDTSLNHHLQEEPFIPFTPQSYSSLQRIQIKKTLASFNSGANLLQLKQTPTKQHLTPGQFVLRTEPDYFDPLQFYLDLVEQQTTYNKQLA